MRTLVLVAALAAAPMLSIETAQAQQANLYPATECVAGERVFGHSNGVYYPMTVLRDSSPGSCLVLMDDFLRNGELEAPVDSMMRGAPPQRPSPAAVALGRRQSLSEGEVESLRHMGLNNPADARIFGSRFQMTWADDGIVANICGPYPNDAVCQTASQQFHASYAEHMRWIDQRNRAYEAEARASSNEPINSGYYQSGQYSRDVAASQSGYAGSGSTTTYNRPVAVQSEREIRRDQDQCRRGSGPC